MSVTVILKAILLVNVYRKWPTELVEFSSYFNLLMFTLSSFYSLGDRERQIAVAYTSTSIALALFLGILLYHIITSVCSTRCAKNLRNKMTQRKDNDSQRVLLIDDGSEIRSTIPVPTSTVVEISSQHSKNSTTVENEYDKQTSAEILASGNVPINQCQQTTMKNSNAIELRKIFLLILLCKVSWTKIN